MEVKDGSANMEVEDDDARLRAEVLAYMRPAGSDLAEDLIWPV